jgi:hypothetical protein
VVLHHLLVDLGRWFSHVCMEQVIAPFLIILRVAKRRALTPEDVTGVLSASQKETQTPGVYSTSSTGTDEHTMEASMLKS